MLDNENYSVTTDIVADNVDDLVWSAVNHITNEGHIIDSRSGNAIQAYDVNYILTNPKNRLHTLRSGAVKYFCRELLAYFKGSLDVHEGLSQASSFWASLADTDGKINSNYGYYIFNEEISGFTNQYNWVMDCILKNRNTRRALININQSYHKSETKDFPCTVGVLFYIKNNTLYCEALSRSTDVITGLPYDMGFFSFIHELIYSDLLERGFNNISLGSTMMKTTFTQIYSRTAEKSKEILQKKGKEMAMPGIGTASLVLHDIVNNTSRSDVVRWIYENSK